MCLRPVFLGAPCDAKYPFYVISLDVLGKWGVQTTQGDVSPCTGLFWSLHGHTKKCVQINVATHWYYVSFHRCKSRGELWTTVLIASFPSRWWCLLMLCSCFELSLLVGDVSSKGPPVCLRYRWSMLRGWDSQHGAHCHEGEEHSLIHETM